MGPLPHLLHKFSFAFVTGRRGRSPRIAVNPKNSLCSFSGTPAARHKSASRIYSVPRPLRDSKNLCPNNGGSKPPPYKRKSAFPEMFASFLNLRTRTLNLPTFAPQSGKIYFAVAHCGVLRGLPLSPLSWFVLSRMRKNEHPNRHRSARAEGSQYDRQKKRL